MTLTHEYAHCYEKKHQPYTGISGLTAAPAQKAGNISQIVYRVRGREASILSYSYDYLSRLSTSTFHNYSDAGVISGTNNYNENLTYDLRGNIQTLQRTGFYQNGGTCTYGQIDNLTYSYSPNTNRLHKVLDGTTTVGDAKSRGFNGNLSTADNSMAYDRNGNLNKNLHKNVSTITYNHLNLPTVITFTSGNTIEFLYDAAGMKLRKTVKVGATVQYVQDYLPGGIEYRQNGTGVKRVEAVFHAEGRYYNTNVDASNTISWRREYNIKDHLGNTRLVFTDRNANGVVDITGTASTSDILQENHYYAFGLPFEGAWLQNDAAARDNKYQYNGKEFNDDFGLNWNDYGARWYDASVGRFTSVDRFAVKYNSNQPYHYGLNNPVVFIDINGDSIKYANKAIEEYVNQYTSATVTDKKGRVKENKNYNAGFAALVNRLKDSKDMFVLTDDASKMIGNDPGQLGEFNASEDGKSFNIVVPDFSSGEKAKLTDIFGGRGAVLAEEVFHATQYLGGELLKVKGENGKFGLKVNSNTTMILIEADAKIYASGSGMGYSSTTSYVEDYNVTTMTGLINSMNGDRQAVGRLLIHGTTKNINPVFGSGGSKTVRYPASYSIY